MSCRSAARPRNYVSLRFITACTIQLTYQQKAYRSLRTWQQSSTSVRVAVHVRHVQGR